MLIDFLIDVIGLTVIVAFIAIWIGPADRWLDRHQPAQLRFAVFAFAVYLADVTVSIFAGVRWPYLRLMTLAVVGWFIRNTATSIRRRQAVGPRHNRS